MVWYLLLSIVVIGLGWFDWFHPAISVNTKLPTLLTHEGGVLGISEVPF